MNKIYLFIFSLIIYFSTQVLAKTTVIIDAPVYTKALKEIYAEEDKAIKLPEKSSYSGIPGSKFWRNVRAGNSYQTLITGVDSGMLINATGENWRQAKNKISTIAPIVLGLIPLIPILLLLFFGKFKIRSGFSNNKILRFKFNERIIHWGVAGLFILLAVTGITLTLGQSLLIPLLGKEVFAIIASSFKLIHNLFGPIFSIFLILMIVRFIKDNLYQKGDINWLLKAGGLFGSHVETWRFNLGEKILFWIIFFACLTISVTGYLLLFSNATLASRELNELFQILHVIASIVMISVIFGHIYMAVAIEGSMSSMTNGYVDENWAKEHHSLWYKSNKNSIKNVN